MARVLVTGGAGFIAAHVMLALLREGHAVRATLRDLARESEVRAMLAAGGAPADAPLGFHRADLLEDAGWAAAVAGCDGVLHVASPLPAGLVAADEGALIRTAREGTLRVLKAARAAGVRRVVVTSSFSAVGYGHPPRAGRYDESDWTDPEGVGVDAYTRSKTLAERAAWDFVAGEGAGMELASINPVVVLGPALGPDLSASLDLIRALLDGTVPATPRVFFGLVDVRDVAELHVKAMTAPEAAGQRFLATSGDAVSLHQIARMLRDGLGPAGRRAPRFELPDLLVRLAALVSPTARLAVPRLGIRRSASSEKARALLGWSPRPPEEAILATAESLLRLGLVKG
ncbi:aldehyde reductase [Ancylobacter dichloromethanicus]|uniref:Dihydroflavonol-4-reductase n=1 Tax=Ancylobacter dichloromethanicus TaxID=518825 RepID=A0A9W6J8T7_9HYPH|nr:aldehyde reductase [Ancylobacter dichloromethanicus]MBS7553211.1 aldehyde reductase [Ancylobacter dichloromethanicus]GLK72991.1 dihydroflavonol-4-reductase [Ancylobacter dichloromethanicus]